MHETLKEDAQTNINILLKFATSSDPKYRLTSYWSLKDYILLTDDYISDISDIINAFVIGVINEDTLV